MKKKKNFTVAGCCRILRNTFPVRWVAEDVYHLPKGSICRVMQVNGKDLTVNYLGDVYRITVNEAESGTTISEVKFIPD